MVQVNTFSNSTVITCFWVQIQNFHVEYFLLMQTRILHLMYLTHYKRLIPENLLHYRLLDMRSYWKLAICRSPIILLWKIKKQSPTTWFILANLDLIVSIYFNAKFASIWNTAKWIRTSKKNLWNKEFYIYY